VFKHEAVLLNTR